MSKRNDAQRIDESLIHIAVLRGHLARADLTDEAIMDAVCMRLSAAIDALNHGEPALGQSLFPDSWRKMRGTRNYIAHGYLTIDLSVIADTVENNLPEMEKVLREEQARLRRGPTAP